MQVGNSIVSLTTNATGQAQYEYYEYSSTIAGTQPITAAFNGVNDYAATQNASQITISKLDAIITLSDATATYGDKIILTATLKDENGNLISGGKTAFKLNGKTLKDANGNVIYIQVVNGTAQITLDGIYSAKTYTIQ